MKTIYKALGRIPTHFGAYHVEFPFGQSKNVAFKQFNGRRNSHLGYNINSRHEFFGENWPIKCAEY